MGVTMAAFGGLLAPSRHLAVSVQEPLHTGYRGENKETRLDPSGAQGTQEQLSQGCGVWWPRQKEVELQG